MKAIIIREPYISLILSGQKTWEMRSSRPQHRGLVGLIKKGSGHVVGTAKLIDVLPALSSGNYAEMEPLHRVSSIAQAEAIKRRWVNPWVLADVRRLPRPVPYRHKRGAQTWVTLEDDVAHKILEQIREAVV
jgi:hypothetical protein